RAWRSRARHGACGAGRRARVGGDPRLWPLQSRGRARDGSLGPSRRATHPSPVLEVWGPSLPVSSSVSMSLSGLDGCGPTTPTRAGRLPDASVDPTEARNVAGFGPDDCVVRGKGRALGTPSGKDLDVCRARLDRRTLKGRTSPSALPW